MMDRESQRKPRPYSKLETDQELIARILAAGHIRRMGEPVDEAAERAGLERKIVWVTP
jgi:hypothetical protein